MALAIASRLRAAWSSLLGGGSVIPWHVRPPDDGGAPVVTPQTVLALTGVYRACSLLADSASSAAPSIFVRQATGGRLQQRDSAAARALATLAQGDAELFAFSCALVGNGYLRIVRDGNGAPYELQAVPPWRVQIEVEAESRALWYRVAADPALGENEVLLPERDMVHARYRVTGSNRLMGVPPMVSCAPAFSLALQSRDVQRSLFANLASPGGVVTAPGKIEPAVAKQMQNEWAANFSGRGVGKVAVLANGLEYKPIVFKANDAQLLEQVQASTLDIARAYGIPRQFLEDGQTMTYASAVESTRALYTLALRGFTNRLADALGARLLTRNERAAGAGIEYNLSSLLILPGAEMAEFLSKLANSGVSTPNELRDGYLNLPDVAGGDVLRAPVNTAPTDQWASGAKAYELGKAYAAGTFVVHEGAIWRAFAPTDSEPNEDSAVWDRMPSFAPATETH